jgi:hypothetical protein
LALTSHHLGIASHCILSFSFSNAVLQVYNSLGSRRSALKKEARLIVERQYALVNVNGEDGWAKSVAIKVRGLLDDAGPSNMDFTDGPSDCNVSQISLPQKKI